MNGTPAPSRIRTRRTSSPCTFFSKAPKLHPNTALITGVVCGVRVEDDKLERARDKAMESILRALAGGGPVTRAAPVTE